MRKRTSLSVKSSRKSLKSESSCIVTPIHALTKNLDCGDPVCWRNAEPIFKLVSLVSEGELLHHKCYGTGGTLCGSHETIVPERYHRTSMKVSVTLREDDSKRRHNDGRQVQVNSCPRQDSNLRSRFRKPMLYPLSYGSFDPLLQSCSNLSIGCRNGNETLLWYRLTR
jgi:hypothetical protein